jgi:hypothetical protein
MIRRLFVPVAVLAAMVVLATPASANGATSQTFNFHGAFPPMTVGPLCGAPGGTLSGTGNAVMHITVNAAGDVWATSTQEAWFTLVQTDPTLPSYSGHYAIWFGGSFNNQNAVVHDNFNVQATGSDGSTINLHIVDHMSISASGQLNVFTTCG